MQRARKPCVDWTHQSRTLNRGQTSARDVDTTEDEGQLTCETKVLLEDNGSKVDDGVASTNLLEDFWRAQGRLARPRGAACEDDAHGWRIR